ncbi:MAG: NAD(+) synthase [Spirochaetales bacterium]|jgi:NAD+ synthase (glutamine-hydrolysing)|nr:NAD(+) synthase [Spirochaetales bacterium]
MSALDYGFFRTAGASLPLKVANPAYNARLITEAMKHAETQDVRLLVLPELCVTGYTCADLFHQDTLLSAAEDSLARILSETKDLDVAAVLGLPAAVENQIFNCAAVIQRGSLLGLVPKSYLPGYGEFYEERWFSPASALRIQSIFFAEREAPIGTDLLFRAADGAGKDIVFGVEICEDLWVPSPPSVRLARAGAVIICNISGSNEIIGKHSYRRDLVKTQSARLCAGYVYAGCGAYESTTDLVFGGAVLVAENGSLLAEGRRFARDEQETVCDIDVDRLLNTRRRLTSYLEEAQSQTPKAAESFRHINFALPQKPLKKLRRYIDPHPFVPDDPKTRNERCEEIFAIQTAGLAKRLEHTKCKTAVIGVSGGLDSTLALLVTVKTFDLLSLPREGVIAITMPGFGTTDRTYTNAVEMIKSLGVTFREIDIRPSCEQHFKDIGHDPAVHDITYENVQARERTRILMDSANKHGGLVIGTGDLSELALGWCTYNGDHMSMYVVNVSIPKTLFKYLVAWVADNVADEKTRGILTSVMDTPISPELLPPDEAGKIKQKTEDILGPYEAHDFFLYHFFRYGAPPDKILFLAEEAFKELPSKSAPYSKANLRAWLRVFLRRFFSQQFKRSCIPDGPKVGTVSLSPRGDWRMPSDAGVEAWVERLE